MMRRLAVVLLWCLPVRVMAQSLEDVRSVLAPLVETYGVSGMEGPVRDAVIRMLPDWARATTDTAGNLMVDVGQGDPLVVFVAPVRSGDVVSPATKAFPEASTSMAKPLRSPRLNCPSSPLPPR